MFNVLLDRDTEKPFVIGPFESFEKANEWGEWFCLSPSRFQVIDFYPPFNEPT